jgi:hypothetical protein
VRQWLALRFRSVMPCLFGSGGLLAALALNIKLEDRRMLARLATAAAQMAPIPGPLERLAEVH